MNKNQDLKSANNKKSANSKNPLGFKEQVKSSYAMRYRNKHQMQKSDQAIPQNVNRKPALKLDESQIIAKNNQAQSYQNKKLDYKALSDEIQRQIKQAMLQKQNKSQILKIQGKQFQAYNNLSQTQQLILKEGRNEQQILYQQFLQMERHYNQQLSQLKQSILIVQSQCQKEKLKVTVAEKDLKQKRQLLRQLRKQYETSVRQSAECQADGSDQVYALQENLRKIKHQHNLQTKQIKTQLAQLQAQNQELDQQIQNLDLIIKEEGGNISNQEYQKKVKQLDEQQQTLRQEIVRLEQESTKLRADIQKIQSVKPLNTAKHQKYLDLYEKVILHKEILKAQKIIETRQSQILQNQIVLKKKQEIESKKQELKKKQSQLEEKSIIIDQLSNQIRDKSTMLLNIFQDNQSK